MLDCPLVKSGVPPTSIEPGKLMTEIGLITVPALFMVSAEFWASLVKLRPTIDRITNKNTLK
jgi:hypothetical protein